MENKIKELIKENEALKSRIQELEELLNKKREISSVAILQELVEQTRKNKQNLESRTREYELENRNVDMEMSIGFIALINKEVRNTIDKGINNDDFKTVRNRLEKMIGNGHKLFENYLDTKRDIIGDDRVGLEMEKFSNNQSNKMLANDLVDNAVMGGLKVISNLESGNIKKEFALTMFDELVMGISSQQVMESDLALTKNIKTEISNRMMNQ